MASGEKAPIKVALKVFFEARFFNTQMAQDGLTRFARCAERENHIAIVLVCALYHLRSLIDDTYNIHLLWRDCNIEEF